LSDFVKKKPHSVFFSRRSNTRSDKPFSATSEFRLHLIK
jgi:hypothetical protein